MSEIRIFESSEFGQVRTTTTNGEPWFCLADVCRVLEIANPRDIKKRLSTPCVDTIDAWVQTGVKENGEPAMRKTAMTFINEQGLYKVIFQSRKPEAERFTDWVTGEVLPSIRKHGMYATDELIANPDLLIQVATALKQEREERQRLEAANAEKDKQLEEAKPKVQFADAVHVSDTCILIGELAKLLKGNGINIGQNRLFEWLRENGYLIKRKGTDYNIPTQKAMDMKLFKVIESTVTNNNGNVIITKTTKVTGKGQQYFVNMFLNAKEEAG